MVANVGDSAGNHLAIDGGSTMLELDEKILFLIVFVVQSMFYLFICLTSSPGYEAKKSLGSNNNAL